VLPGLIDPHVHLGFLGSFAEQARNESRAAVAGGVTTWGSFLRPPAGKGFLETFEEHKNLYEKNAICDVFFHNTCSTQKAMDDIPACPEIGIIVGYKGPLLELLGAKELNDGILLTAWQTIARLGRPVWAMVHAENPDMIAAGREIVEKKQGRTDFAAWRDHRPNYVEAHEIKSCIEIARITKCPLYIVHNTISEAVDIIGEAKAKGQEVIGETCPIYLTHTSDEPIPQMFKDNPALGVTNPPFRDHESIERLWEGLKNGAITTIGSDSVFLTKAQKGNNIWTAPMGISNGVEMILPVMLSEGVHKGRISLEKLVQVCSHNVARVFGLYPQKGDIAVGFDADLVIVDLYKKIKVTLDVLHSSVDWNIYEGWEFTGWPIMTILLGQVVMEDGKITGAPGIGRYIPCKCE
jgi:dihydropyrimidinase